MKTSFDFPLSILVLFQSLNNSILIIHIVFIILWNSLFHFHLFAFWYLFLKILIHESNSAFFTIVSTMLRIAVCIKRYLKIFLFIKWAFSIRLSILIFPLPTFIPFSFWKLLWQIRMVKSSLTLFPVLFNGITNYMPITQESVSISIFILSAPLLPTHSAWVCYWVFKISPNIYYFS